MSTFGKYGVGGTNPGKVPSMPDESPVDMVAATMGTERGNPDSKPEVGSQQGSPSHN